MSESDSGTVTPILVAETASVTYDCVEDEEVYVLPTGGDDLFVSGDLNIDGIVTDENGCVDEDASKLSSDMAAICKHLIESSTSYFASYKAQALRERNNKVSELESKYFTDMQLQEDIITGLNDDIVKLNCNHAEQVAKLERTYEDVTGLMAKRANRSSMLLRKRKVFQQWLLQAQEERKFAEISRIVQQNYRRKIYSRGFSALLREAKSNMKRRLTIEKKTKVDETTQKIIEEYELKLNALRKELDEAHSQISNEANSRKQFEADLKRVFLKNLTQMNMEAYSLFNNGEPPVDNSLPQVPPATVPGHSDRAVPSAVRGVSPTVIKHSSEEPAGYIYPQTAALMNHPTSAVLSSKPIHAHHGPASASFSTNISSSSTYSRPARYPQPLGASKSQKSHIANSKLQEQLGIDFRHNVDMRGSIENQVPRAYPGVKPTPL